MARGGRQGGWGVVGMNLAGETFRTTCRLGDGRRSLGWWRRCSVSVRER
jgi:hypothetical protein